MIDKRLELAKNLVDLKKNKDARQLLEDFLKDNRADMYAWWLYAETWSSIEDKVRIWGYCLRFNPGSVEAKKALSLLRDTTVTVQPNTTKQTKLPGKKVGTSLTFRIFSGCAGIVIISVIVGMIRFFISQPDNPAPYRHTQPVEYYLYVPKDYSNDEIWPLFVGLHGSGGSGLDCWNMWQPYAEKEDFILLCPTSPGDGGGYQVDVGERVVWSAVNDVQRGYRVSSRMFLAGFSAGAYFIQFFASHYPDSVSGLAILSTGYYIKDIQAHVPMLVVIGGIDSPDSIRANEEFVSYMKQNGFDIDYHVLPGVSHWPATKAKSLTIELFRKTIGK